LYSFKIFLSLSTDVILFFFISSIDSLSTISPSRSAIILSSSPTISPFLFIQSPKSSVVSEIYYIPIKLYVPSPANITAMDIYYDNLVDLLSSEIKQPVIGFVVDTIPVTTGDCSNDNSSYNGTFFLCLISRNINSKYNVSLQVQALLNSMSLDFILPIQPQNLQIFATQSSGQLSSGGISGIIIAIIFILAISSVIIYFIYRKNHKNKEKQTINTITNTKNTFIPKKLVKTYIEPITETKHINNPLVIANELSKKILINNPLQDGPNRVELHPVQIKPHAVITDVENTVKKSTLPVLLTSSLTSYDSYNSTINPATQNKKMDSLKNILLERRRSVRAAPLPVLRSTATAPPIPNSNDIEKGQSKPKLRINTVSFEPLKVNTNDIIQRSISVKEIASKFEKPGFKTLPSSRFLNKNTDELHVSNPMPVSNQLNNNNNNV